MNTSSTMGSGLYLGIALTLLLAMAVNAYGLTTFGKSQNNNPQSPPQQQTPKGRECSFESDCQGIQNTSCVPDPRDEKLRCLCGDNEAPLNGACKSKFKGPKHSCMMNEECVEGAECVDNKVHGNREAPKICKCSEGLVENSHLCSGSPIGRGIAVGLLLATVFFSRTNLLY